MLAVDIAAELVAYSEEQQPQRLAEIEEMVGPRGELGLMRPGKFGTAGRRGPPRRG